MGWFGMGSSTPKCCCGSTGSTGTLLADDFDRADDTDLGGDWIEEAGDAEVSSGLMLVTSDNSQIIGNVANGSGPQTHITCRVMLAAGSSTARLFVGWANTSNYLYATLTTTAITVGHAGGGSQSEVVTITPGTWYTFTLCYNGTQLIGTANGVQSMKTGLAPPGQKHGVGCGASDVSFDEVTAKKVSENCQTCTSIVPVASCPSCVQNEIPRYWAVEISGATNNTCVDCDNVNGLWILDDVRSRGGSAGCVDGLNTPVNGEFATVCGNPARLDAVLAGQIAIGGFLQYAQRVRLSFWSDISTIYLHWQQAYGSIDDPNNKIDCLASASLPLVFQNHCSGGTCTIAPLA